MKNFFLFTLVAFSLIAVAGCKNAKKVMQNGAEKSVSLPNPIKDSSAEEMKEKFGVVFNFPEGAENFVYTTINDKLFQVDFNWKGAECNVREQTVDSENSDDNIEDISGFYYEWKNESDVNVYGKKAKAKWTNDGEGNIVGICIWRDDDKVFSVSMRENASEENLLELANSVYGN